MTSIRWVVPALLLLAGLSPAADVGPPQVRNAVRAREMAVEAGLLHGVCAVELIRPDLLSVTLDGGIVGLLNDAEHPLLIEAVGGSASMLQKPEAFTLRSDTDPAYRDGVAPADVGRASYEWHNCLDSVNRWPLCVNEIFRHDYYLQLREPLQPGHRYTVQVNRPDPDTRFANTATFTCDGDTTTKVIKINQVAYSSVASRRYAYLGWWAGSMGAVPYDDFKTFLVTSEETGQHVLEGKITKRAELDKNSGERLYEMDLSYLEPGTYHIVVPGLARSETFHVGGPPVFEMYYHALRAFFHQRCGQEFKEPWSAFTKAACHAEIWESGAFVAGPGALHHSPGHRDIHNGYQPKPGELKMPMKGGYHDAADFDTFAYHLPATAQILAAYEMYPKAFTDGQLNLPESGNGIPDILDEAEWGLSWYLEHQYPNGSVPLGRINQCDARKQNIEGGKEAPMPPYGIMPPRQASTPTFAAVAAQYARCLRPFDPARANRYQAAAIKAYRYATTHTALEEWETFNTDDVPLMPPDTWRGQHRAGRGAEEWLRANTWAAGELLLNTGESSYNDYVADHHQSLNHWTGPGLRMWAYLRCDPERANRDIQATLMNQLLGDRNWGADARVQETEQAGYRMGNGQGEACGWGTCQGANHGDTLLRAYYLTRNRKYLDAACLNADWHLGANPLSKTLVTGMGYRYPNRPEISWFLYEGQADNDLLGPTVRGIPIYGIGPALRSYPGTPKEVKDEQTWPLWRSWRDAWGTGAEIYSEFTTHQTVGPAAMLYATLYALEREAGTMPNDVKPRCPLGAEDR